MKDSVLWKHPYETEDYGRYFDTSSAEADGFESIETGASESVETDTFELIEDSAQNTLFYEWHKAIINEPVMKSLEALADFEGVWVGAEAELFKKVKELTSTKAQKSGPFPSTPGELLEHVHEVYERTWAFPAAGFEVLDFRKLTEEEAEGYEVPGWGIHRPLLVRKVGSTREKPSFYEAFLELARYERPLLVAILKSTRKQRRWSGTTSALSGRLWKYYPDVTSVWALAIPGLWHRYPDYESRMSIRSEDYRYEGAMDPFRMLDYSLDAWIGSRDDFSEHPKDLDLLTFYKLVKRYSRILKEFGVKVTAKKPYNEESTRWTIEGPRWNFGDMNNIMARFWYISRAHEAGPRVLVGPGMTSLGLMSVGDAPED